MRAHVKFVLYDQNVPKKKSLMEMNMGQVNDVVSSYVCHLVPECVLFSSVRLFHVDLPLIR